jgi:hypothetical protein
MQIELSVRVGTTVALERVRQLLLAEGVTSVHMIEPREVGPGVATFRVEADRDVREALSRSLVEARVGILEIVRKRRELESIFLRLTGEGDDVSKAAGLSPGAAADSAGLPS